MKIQKTKRVSINIALKIILLLGFAVFFLFSIYTDTVDLYVHPRIIPFMIFGAFSMIMIALMLFGDLFKHETAKSSSWQLALFLIPLIMAIMLPAKPLNSSTLTLEQIQLKGTNNSLKVTDVCLHELYENDVTALETEDTSGEVLIMDESNFYKFLSAIYAEPDKYDGAQIEVTGFVFNESVTFNDDEFVPARLMMTCCAADMHPIGLLCKYDKAAELQKDSWVIVRGTLGKSEFNGELIPCIYARSVEATDEPDKIYIYPY